MKTIAECPSCGQADRVEKVSTIYLAGIGLHRRVSVLENTGDRQEPPLIQPWLINLPPEALRVLSRRLAPPSSGKEPPFRPLHPDMVVFTFSLVAPIFLYGILSTQSGMLPLALAILIGFYVFYFWKRRAMIVRYENQKKARQAVQQRVRGGIERWMTLYYCARDDIVFEPEADLSLPADQIGGIYGLFEENFKGG